MVGILLVTHGNMGDCLLNTAHSIFADQLPLHVASFGVINTSDMHEITRQIKLQIQQLDSGDGVLILTDLYGATPYNIASKIKNFNTGIVSGLNLSMLIRALNYPRASLNEMMSKAETGGHFGITANRCLLH